MKKVFALILCLALVLVMPAGCKKKVDSKELNESRLSSDLLDCTHLYYYAHVGAVNSMTGLKIVDKTEKDNTVSFSVTAKAMAPSANIELAANMKYVYENNMWKLDNENVEITKKEITITAGPDLESTLMELDNYVSIVGNALAVQDEEQQLLPAYNVYKATWDTQYSEKAKTATMNVTYNSEELSFTGYYNLTFGEYGWAFETGKVEGDERGHILLHLETLEQKEAESTDKK